jgi:hypothetical protein
MSKSTLRGIRFRRFLHKTFRDVRGIFTYRGQGTPEDVLDISDEPDSNIDKVKKYKSTAAVAVCGVAIGISHVAALSAKYNRAVSNRNTLIIGVGTGVLISGVWYNYVDASNEGVTEQDLNMMFEMANGTGLGSLTEDSDSAKSLDILHTIVTGNTSEGSSKSRFDKDESSDKETKTDNVFGVAQKFTESTERSDVRSSAFSGISVGKSLSSRKSFLPDMDKENDLEDTESSSIREHWLDI